jgi:hypothetical protein
MAIETGLPVAEAVPRVAPVVQAESLTSVLCHLAPENIRYVLYLTWISTVSAPVIYSSYL